MESFKLIYYIVFCLNFIILSNCSSVTRYSYEEYKNITKDSLFKLMKSTVNKYLSEDDYNKEFYEEQCFQKFQFIKKSVYTNSEKFGKTIKSIDSLKELDDLWLCITNAHENALDRPQKGDIPKDANTKIAQNSKDEEKIKKYNLNLEETYYIELEKRLNRETNGNKNYKIEMVKCLKEKQILSYPDNLEENASSLYLIGTLRFELMKKKPLQDKYKYMKNFLKCDKDILPKSQEGTLG